MTTATKSTEETQATARLRALGEGVRIYVLEPGYRYCVPSASGYGSAYQVLARGDTATCSCPAGSNDKFCKHLAAVHMRMEAEESLQQVRSLAVTTGLQDALERSLEDKVAELYS